MRRPFENPVKQAERLRAFEEEERLNDLLSGRSEFIRYVLANVSMYGRTDNAEESHDERSAAQTPWTQWLVRCVGKEPMFDYPICKDCRETDFYDTENVVCDKRGIIPLTTVGSCKDYDKE